MNRAAWLTERRAAIVATYDGGAPDYDHDEYPSDTQREWVSGLVERLPVNSLVLDAPCGTGKDFRIMPAAGQRAIGVEQLVVVGQAALASGMADVPERPSVQGLRLV